MATRKTTLCLMNMLSMLSSGHHTREVLPHDNYPTICLVACFTVESNQSPSFNYEIKYSNLKKTKKFVNPC